MCHIHTAARGPGTAHSSLRRQATRETGLGHTAKPFESRQGEWWTGREALAKLSGPPM